MWALYDILRYSFSSVIWGILIAVACMTLFVFLIKGWYKDATFSPISYVVGALEVSQNSIDKLSELLTEKNEQLPLEFLFAHVCTPTELSVTL